VPARSAPKLGGQANVRGRHVKDLTDNVNDGAN
jgi:hypothetical protein